MELKKNASVAKLDEGEGGKNRRIIEEIMDDLVVEVVGGSGRDKGNDNVAKKGGRGGN